MKKVPIRSIMILLFLSLSSFFSHLLAQETVDSRSGRLILTVSDVILPAGPVDLEIKRTLQPNPGKPGLLGSRWRLNVERRLVKEKTQVRIETESGPIIFTQEGSAPDYKNAFGERIHFEKNGQAFYTKKDGTKETYTSDGLLKEIDHRNYNKVIFSYGANKRLSRVEGPRKHFLKVNTDPQGRLSRIESSNGDQITYQYSGENLSQVQINGAPAIRYQYDEKGLLTQIYDPKTGEMLITYDDKSRVLTRRFADGGLEQHKYPKDSTEHQIIDPLGGVTKKKWNAAGSQEETTDPLENKTLVEYNALGFPVTVTDALRTKTEMSYDRQGRLISIKEGSGGTIRFEYLKDTFFRSAIIGPDGSKQINHYDGQMNLLEAHRGGMTVLKQTYYPDGMVKRSKELGRPEERFTYDPSGRVMTQSNGLGHQTSFEYDQQGNLIRTINPLGGVTLYNYNSQKQVTSITAPTKGTTRYEYTPQGLLAKTIDPRGGIISFTYDFLGRLLTQSDPSGGVTRNEYDLQGRIIKKVYPDGLTSLYQYDLVGNLVKETNTLDQTRRFSYDSKSRIIKETTAFGQEIFYEYDRLNNLISWKDNLGAGENFKYNQKGQLQEKITPLGGISRYNYDALGNLLSTTDPLGKEKRFSYSRTGELSEAAEPDGSIARYDFDPAGTLSSITHPGGGKSRFSYDPMGNLTGTINPLGQTQKKTYDQTGRLLSQTDAKGQTTRFVYNTSGQLVEKQLPDKTKVTYHYDPSGRLIKVDDGQFPLQFSYTSPGILNKVDYPAINQTVSYTYDNQGLLKTLKGSDGNPIGYEYNKLKQLRAIVLPDSRKIKFTYNAKNVLHSIDYPNGIIGQWDYDRADRIIKITYRKMKGKIIAAWSYQYDPAGNLIEEKGEKGQRALFTYDPAGQLIEELRKGKKIHYRYGPGGNRNAVEEDKTMLQYQHDKADRLIKTDDETLVYDENGNVFTRKTSKGQMTYEYNPENRLIKVSRSDGETTSFGYAPTGERVWRRDSKGQTTYLYDGFNLIQELGEKGNPKALYVHGPGIDSPLAMVRDGKNYFYHPDRLGSIRLLTDRQGKIVAAYDYDAFGKIRSQRGSLPNPFTFTGREWDPEINLYYFRARYYDPKLGRFLSPDAMPPNLTKLFTLNPYLYTPNNPLRFKDPLGLAWEDPFVQMGYADNPEESLEYWRMLKSNPDSPHHQMADAMIKRLEQSIRDEGRRVPPPPNPRPDVGRSTINQGANAPRSSDTLNIKPGATPTTPTGPGGITRPGFYKGVGGGLGGFAGLVNLQACLDEGNSKAWCVGQLGVGVAVGVAAGAIVGGVAAWLSVPATAIAVGGAVLGGLGALKSGDRWSRAPETKALAEQEANKLAQKEEHIKDALASLEGRLGALITLGKKFCDAQYRVSESARKAENTAGKAKKKLESSLASLNAEVSGALTTSCTQDQSKLTTLMEKIKQAEGWIDTAGKGYPEAIQRLTQCASQKAIDDADYLVRGSTALSLKAEQKVREALADIDSLQKSIPKLKEKVKDIRSRMSSLENNYLLSQQEVDKYASDTREFAKEAEGVLAQFNAMKTGLQLSASKLTALIPPKFEWDLKNIIAKINTTQPPCPVQTQEYVNMAKAAQEMISGGSFSSLSGIGSMISAGGLAAQKLAIDSALSICGSLNPPKGNEADNATQAMFKLTNRLEDWLKTIAEYKGWCLTKLYPKATPPVLTKPSVPSTPQPPPACTYDYNGWFPCQPDGTMSRTVRSSSPPGCVGTPVLTGTCPYKPPPAPSKTIAGEGYGCTSIIKVGETASCSWVVVYSDGTVEDLTGKASWNPGRSIKGTTPGIITVTATYQGIMRTSETKVIGGDGKTPTGYDPKKDPGLPGRDKPVDLAKIKTPTDGFSKTTGQGTRPPKPENPQTSIPIPTDYTTKPADKTQKPTDQTSIPPGTPSEGTAPNQPDGAQPVNLTPTGSSLNTPPAKSPQPCAVTDADREKLRSAIRSRYGTGSNHGPWYNAACKPLTSGCITWVSSGSKPIEWKLRDACTQQDLAKCWEMFNCVDKAVMAKDWKRVEGCVRSK